MFSELPHHTSGRTFGPDGFNEHQTSLHSVLLVESGFEPGTLRLQSQYLITRPPRPLTASGITYSSYAINEVFKTEQQSKTIYRMIRGEAE
ncbi:hypothetical protein AVEN_196555-1 [Araneus ventricosus]|uniref:Uncharacterized protein n=1 Tax=Araneus ventricosus TaxID=182803 RepID=A0A4Y2INH0_ARAVE|nr:hypothetical protein AVEN_196555-1 [Araneus ventricosus]